MAQQQIVHGPERAHGSGGLGCLGGKLGLRMDVDERQVPPDVTDLGVHEDLPHGGFGLAAIRALEIAELDDGHHRLLRPADVVTLRVDRWVEVLDQLDVAQDRPRPPLR